MVTEFGKQLTASLSALARLGVADHMGESAVSVEDLAARVGAHAPSLYRVMRMLASVGVFTEEPGGKFALTPVGETLKTDAQGKVYSTALLRMTIPVPVDIARKVVGSRE